jgi:hypothetical protein
METSQMKLQAIVSSIALAAALTFSGAAVAQNMLNDTAIPADQIDSFKGKCEALRAEANASGTSGGANTEPVVDPTTTASTGGGQPIENSDPAARDNWAAALASLTIEQCDEAGFAP